MLKKIIIILFFIILLLFLISPTVLAADPKLITTINSAFGKIESWLVKLAAPAAAIAICTGLFIKKFSFGDEERMRLGKKLIRTSLFSYVFILLLDLILSTLQNLLIN